MSKWARTTGWTQYDNLSAFSPPAKTTVSSKPASNDNSTSVGSDDLPSMIWKKLLGFFK